MSTKIWHFLLLLPLLFLGVACLQDPSARVGFDTDVEPDGSGSTTFYVDPSVETVYLEGTVSLTQGALELELEDPDGMSVYSQTVQAPDTLDIEMDFPADLGDWKLRYQSIDGVGTLKLHVTF